MKRKSATRNIPTRLATGAFILHSGIEKWRGSTEQAQAIHEMAATAYPIVRDIPPKRFLRLLALSEILTGSLLLLPWVSNASAGAALSSFSGPLVGLYWRTPGMRRQGSVWPEQRGIALSKDIWMLGIGLGLLADARSRARDRRTTRWQHDDEHEIPADSDWIGRLPLVVAHL